MTERDCCRYSALALRVTQDALIATEAQVAKLRNELAAVRALLQSADDCAYNASKIAATLLDAEQRDYWTNRFNQAQETFNEAARKLNESLR